MRVLSSSIVLTDCFISFNCYDDLAMITTIALSCCGFFISHVGLMLFLEVGLLIAQVIDLATKTDYFITALFARLTSSFMRSIWDS